MKFYRAEQKEGKYKTIIFGIELERSKDKISLLGVNETDKEDVDIFDLSPKEYGFKVIDKEAVEHRFRVALLHQESLANQATIDLMEAKRNLDFCKKKVMEHFK